MRGASCSIRGFLGELALISTRMAAVPLVVLILLPLKLGRAGLLRGIGLKLCGWLLGGLG